MSEKTCKVGEVAALARVTVRTLHHYDAIGLLCPARRSANGYRLYTQPDLLRLQHIQLGRNLGFSLEEIKAQLDDPAFDQRRALRDQREVLVARLDETHAMIRAVDAYPISPRPLPPEIELWWPSDGSTSPRRPEPTPTA